jgi:AICAR transformylase/IMP cyclohydrolase PurH
MVDLIQPKISLISVFEKDGIIDLAKSFRERSIEIIST